MKKSKNNNFILNIINICLGVGAYLCMLFPFVLQKTTTTISNTTTNKTDIFSFSSFLDILKLDSEKLWAWKTSNVFMIITLIFVCLVVILNICQLFIKNKTLNLIFKYVSIITISLSLIYILFFIIGCFLQSNSVSSYGITASCAVFPHCGPALLTLFSLVCAVLSLKVSNKN